MKNILTCILSFFAIVNLYGYDDALYKPWFTGTVIAFQASMIEVGKINVQPYLPVQLSHEKYTSNWGLQKEPFFLAVVPYTFLSTGLTEKMDIVFTLQATYNRTEGRDYIHFGDQSIMLEFLLMSQDDKSLKPSVVFAIQETFPTGKYQRLDPNKLLADWTGNGAFVSLAAIFVQKQFLLPNKHLLNVYANLFYAYPLKVHVNGFNGYGGGFGTGGVVFPGCQTIALLSYEYQITQNWVLATDFVYTHQNQSRFKGNPGVTAFNTVATVGGPSTDQLSMSPSLEYNFSQNLGLFVGVFFTYAGRNANAFVAPVVSVNMTF
ncbi:MAG: hypothetical protein P4L16_01155 [Chlamydiales bacterium]|nr:hypothetical protein [Chlamydiales bacterium]